MVITSVQFYWTSGDAGPCAAAMSAGTPRAGVVAAAHLYFPLQLAEPSRPRDRRINAGEFQTTVKARSTVKRSILRLAAPCFGGLSAWAFARAVLLAKGGELRIETQRAETSGFRKPTNDGFKLVLSAQAIGRGSYRHVLRRGAAGHPALYLPAGQALGPDD